MKDFFKKEALVRACIYTILWIMIFLIFNLLDINPIDWKAMTTAEIAVFFAYLVGYRDGNNQ